MSTHVVTAPSLNLRSAPKVLAENRLALLPQGQLVDKIRVAPGTTKWFEVSTILNGTLFTGFVDGSFLAERANTVFPVFNQLQAVHLEPPQAMRAKRGTWAYPLSEPNMPKRNIQADLEERKQELLKIVDWLDVQNSERYRPGQYTYCNIYAYDYCCLADVYIPRVWWTPNAIIKLLSGTEVAVKYDVSVKELTANDLFNWFVEYGTQFGWRRLNNANELQDGVNQGKVGIISGENKHESSRILSQAKKEAKGYS